MFKKPMYKRFNELGTGGTRAGDVKGDAADNTDTALKRNCVEGLIYAAKLQALLDKHGDSVPEHVRDLAYTCIEVSEAFNTTLERIGAEQPVIIRTESFDARYDGINSLPPACGSVS